MAETYIAEPLLFLTGCRPWPPPPERSGCCPVCGSNVRDHRAYCGWSDEGSDAFETRVAAARTIVEARESIDAGRQRAALKLAKAAKIVLSERDRRRIWNGYRRTILAATVGSDVTNLARVGREWLTKIQQEPAW